MAWFAHFGTEMTGRYDGQIFAVPVLRNWSGIGAADFNVRHVRGVAMPRKSVIIPAVTVPVGECGPDLLALSAVTEQALWAGLAAVRPGGRLSDVGHAVESLVRPHGYGLLEDYTGHRWWTADEVVRSRERFFPGRLPELLPACLAGEPVAEPFEWWN